LLDVILFIVRKKKTKHNSCIVPYRQLEHLVEPSFDTATFFASHENIDFVEIGTAIQQFLQENFTHKTGNTGNKDDLVYEEGYNFGLCSFFHSYELKHHGNFHIY